LTNEIASHIPSSIRLLYPAIQAVGECLLVARELSFHDTIDAEIEELIHRQCKANIESVLNP
jgi:hypothetical protein